MPNPTLFPTRIGAGIRSFIAPTLLIMLIIFQRSLNESRAAGANSTIPPAGERIIYTGLLPKSGR
jgi:hypothetical protein